MFPFYKDWSQWLAGAATLVSVEYDVDAGVVLSNEIIVDNTSTVTVSFSTVGQFTLCAKATDSGGNVKSVKVIYNVIKCKNNYYP